MQVKCSLTYCYVRRENYNVVQWVGRILQSVCLSSKKDASKSIIPEKREVLVPGVRHRNIVQEKGTGLQLQVRIALISISTQTHGAKFEINNNVESFIFNSHILYLESIISGNGDSRTVEGIAEFEEKRMVVSG